MKTPTEDKKLCPSCKRELPISAFGLNSKANDKLSCYCLECKRKKHREYYLKNRNKILKKNTEYMASDKGKEYSRKRYQENKEKYAKWTLEYKSKLNRDLRLQIMEKLGGVICVWCGNTDYRVLTIDHINNDGKQERKKLKRDALYKKILSHSEDEMKKKYQILCRNCNWLKHLEVLRVRREERLQTNAMT